MFVYAAGIDLLVNRVDLFGKPVSLNFNGKDKSKSFIGACFSAGVLVFFIWALIIFSQDMFKKKNPKTIMSQSFHENPAAMTIDPDSFAFAFGVQDPVTYFHYINSSIYTIDLTRQQLSRELQADGTLSEVWSSVDLEYETCTTAHFGAMGHKFADIELDALYCLKMNQPGLDEINIQGVFESPMYQYIQATVKACDNVTSGGTCGTPDELQYYLGGGFFATYFTNTAIDPKDYKSPNINYRDSYYTSVTYPYYKELTLYVAPLEVKSDVGWLILFLWKIMYLKSLRYFLIRDLAKELTEDVEVQDFIAFEKTVENLMFRKDMGAVLNFVVRVDKIQTIYERSYTKISDVLADVNGLGSAVIIAFAFFLRPYSHIKFNESLINEMFEIKDPNDKGGDKKDSGDKAPKKKKAKRSGSKSSNNGEKKSPGASRKNSKAEEPKRKENHLRIEVGDKSQTNFMLNSPSDSFNISKIPFVQSPSKDPQGIELSNSVLMPPRQLTPLKESSPPSLSELDPPAQIPNEKETNRGEDQSLFRSPESMRAENLSVIGLNSRGLNNPDSGTYRSQLLQYKPSLVKPTNKILEHYDEQSHEDLDIVLENMIVQHNQETRKRGDSYKSPSLKRKATYLERAINYREALDGKMSFNKKEEESVREGEDQSESQGESVLDESELKVKAQELPEKLTKSSYKLNITFGEYLKSIFYKNKEMKEKFRLLNEGVRRIEERLDIFKVFKKFREVDKLRLLMFESEQLVLFDSLPKPELALKEGEANQVVEKKRKSVEHLRESQFVSDKRRNDLIALSYENLKKKYEKSMIDDRLLDIYDNLE